MKHVNEWIKSEEKNARHEGTKWVSCFTLSLSTLSLALLIKNTANSNFIYIAEKSRLFTLIIKLPPSEKKQNFKRFSRFLLVVFLNYFLSFLPCWCYSVAIIYNNQSTKSFSFSFQKDVESCFPWSFVSAQSKNKREACFLHYVKLNETCKSVGRIIFTSHSRTCIVTHFKSNASSFAFFIISFFSLYIEDHHNKQNNNE
jgi:hypothetical protein